MALRYLGPLEKPNGQRITALTLEPAEKAVPSLIRFLSDPDPDVQNYAIFVINRYFPKDAEPYLRTALASTDNKTLNGVLFTVQTGRYVGLTDEVRKVAWSAGDVMVQLSAVLALEGLGNDRGLKKVAERHPNDKVRGAARSMIQWRVNGKGDTHDRH